jgi:hypothetical protein
MEGGAVKERPILFSGPMVRAILDGGKTMTRRVVKQRDLDAMEGKMLADYEAHNWCTYGRIGDRLWVRETWNRSEAVRPTIVEPIIYRADLAVDGGPKWSARWRSPIHMPRWASRITLEVTAVRVERVQDITTEDATAEGVCEFNDCHAPMLHVSLFGELWDSINGKRKGCAWADNPWVWVVSFRRVAR